MPYIESSRRPDVVRLGLAETTGELNYLFTMTMLRLEAEQGLLVAELVKLGKANLKRKADGTPLNYAAINDVMGAYISAYIEYRRRRRKVLASVPIAYEKFYFECGAIRYEQEKISENGDCYPPGTPL